ncbi:aspartyl/asparaginyl-tRNA synthetase [Umezawaea tangerina]|uniref:Aspartyl/asparaginyl-tRNA synthetase n=2 Tax=Umezawaea tangerina TaxID=84725 RepID=A0A2T0SMA1_9PSEU|nr:aspartyl/asparaginyl-tRNA synthetase [Umezawaea tangerina]
MSRIAHQVSSAVAFGDFVAEAAAAGRLVVQPRMGFSDPGQMRSGLIATKLADATTVGTITLDSYTRVGADGEARRALAEGVALNGYPIVAHEPSTTAAVVEGLRGRGFPVQIRHGSAHPEPIVAALLGAGFTATEGGPVSYCLPYSRLPLRDSVDNWSRSCELLAAVPDAHLETFGGCMMGQLCPPSLLVAISVLEGIFFRRHGLRSISLSYAQQTDAGQDEDAMRALRRLGREFLDGVQWHVVVYAYMGVYPRTPKGALSLLAGAARLAARTGGARLIVKTVAESSRIPTIAENVAALEHAARAAERAGTAPAGDDDSAVYQEARAIVDAVLDLDPDLGRGLVRAFELGYLDVPYCLHPDNAGRTRGHVDGAGRLAWSRIGALPIGHLVTPPRAEGMTSATLLTALTHVERTFDDERLERTAQMTLTTTTAGTTTAPPSPREHLTSPVTRTVMRVQDKALTAAREYLRDNGFTELLPAVIGPVTDPGGRGSKQVDVDYYGHRYKLMTSAILYKQASLLGFDKMFSIAPNVRLEPPETANTSRHLAEFHQLDVEIAGAKRDDALKVVEELVAAMVDRVVTEMPAELEELGRDKDAFTDLLSGAFGRVTHGAAVADLRGLGHAQSADAEIDWEGEAILSRKSSRPFFITDYPKGSRGFYDREDPAEPGVLRNFDLIAPEGFGELCSGSEREFEYARIVARMRETGENPAKYGWYLQMVREGIPASAGFGIGVQRFVRYLCGLDAVWQASAYPKIPGVVSW